MHPGMHPAMGGMHPGMQGGQHPDYYPREREREHRDREREHERHEERERRRTPKHQTTSQDVRNFPIGFVYSQVPAGATQEIEVKPQVRFQGHRLSSLSVGTQMELDPAPPGIVITLLVHNVDTAAQDFGAVLYGLVEETND
jgi:hypothetical protein